MLDRPDAAMLLAIVADFLRERAGPALPDRLAFEARIAANALDTAAREIAFGAAGEAAERTRLQGLLDSVEDDLETLNAQLADRLRTGELSPDEPGVSMHLFATALEKLAVDQPSYSTYVRAIAAREES